MQPWRTVLEDEKLCTAGEWLQERARGVAGIGGSRHHFICSHHSLPRAGSGVLQSQRSHQCEPRHPGKECQVAQCRPLPADGDGKRCDCQREAERRNRGALLARESAVPEEETIDEAFLLS